MGGLGAEKATDQCGDYLREIEFSGPNFICIGGHKCGTSWLWSALQQQPDFYLPIKKEMHYFDRATRYPSPSYLSEQSILRRAFSLSNKSKEFRAYLIEDLRRVKHVGDYRALRWLYRYYFGHISDEWYMSLFQSKGEKLAGDITPAYSLLDVTDVRAAYKLLPKTRFFIILRHPVDRAWSHLRFNMLRPMHPDRWSFGQMRAFLEGDEQELRSDYPSIIKRWRSVVPENQFKIFFYDDLVENPEDFLRAIVSFISGSDEESPDDFALPSPVNVSQRMDVPIEIRNFLERKYSSEVKELGWLLHGMSELQWTDLVDMQRSAS